MSVPNPIIVEMEVVANNVPVAMSVATQYDLPIDLETLEATANGDYDAPTGKAYNRVEVDVPGPSGTVQINSNGTHDVKDYASAEVSVPMPDESYWSTGPYSGYRNLYRKNMHCPGGTQAGFDGAENLETFITEAGDMTVYYMFGDCFKLKTVEFRGASKAASYLPFRGLNANNSALESVTLGGVGHAISTITFPLNYNGVFDLTIYVADDQTRPLSGHPFGCPNANIIYRSSVSGEILS